MPVEKKKLNFDPKAAFYYSNGIANMALCSYNDTADGLIGNGPCWTMIFMIYCNWSGKYEYVFFFVDPHFILCM